MNVELKEGERIDDLQRNGLKIIQDPGRFCFGMDAVLLSGFATDAGAPTPRSAMKGARLLDMGTGTGILPILLSAKTKASELVGLEIQEESAEMASRSVMLNDLAPRVKIIQGDIKEAGSLFGAASFDVVTCNPPYMTGGHGIINKDAPKTIARHELLCSFDDVARNAAYVLKEKGRFMLVHRPFRLAEIIVTLSRYKLEVKRMQLVYPFIDHEPNMVLIEAVKGGKARMTVQKPLVVYEKPGVYTPEIYDIYGY
ncbi:tRNA1(Val) (adenine(37)-N6)-methyltransferase [Butyrivibrio sp. MC2013]|uniref:tRNA1(Val) (adenine(37)-N6)-methyltransferase n=1 Tax=Butyrivibrio sp. MC2013 TaxID=1280686 RepID=UPI00042398C9|nr:tRNA1(Val) (adenine(37)-N6)-methyltransferase [Butyrivibrio sp. MC2013]